MALPIVGQALYLEITTGFFAGKYKSRLGDIQKNHLLIDIPIAIDSGRPEPLSDDVELHIYYQATDGAPCSFYSKVEGRTIQNIPLLQIKRPVISEIKRNQRREYLRVPASLTIELVSVNTQTNEVKLVKANTVDLSGGGVLFSISRNHDISTNDTLGFTLILPSQPKSDEILGKMRVLRKTDHENDCFYSARFIEISETSRQKIIKYCFKRQLELKGKGWFEQ